MKLLIVGDSPALYSGQARMVHELAARFAEVPGMTVTVAGWFHLIATRELEVAYEIVPCLKEKPETLESALQMVEPDLVLAIGDPENFAWLAQRRVANQGQWLLAGYLNIEWDELPWSAEVILDAFDALAVTSEAGARAVGRADVRVVHLGVDTDVFTHALEAPGFVFGRELPAEAFVILLNAQNTVRKNLPMAMAAVKQFADECPDRVICLINAKAQGEYDLVEQVVRLGGDDLFWFNPLNQGPSQTVEDEALALLYAASDVLLVTATTEGFCLPVLEAMATRTLVVAPHAYSMPELIGYRKTFDTLDAGERGILYDARTEFMAVHMAAFARIPAKVDIVRALKLAHWMWHDDEPRTRVTLDAAEAFAQTKSWQATFEGIASLLDTAAARPAWPDSTRCADGQPIDKILRIRARQCARGSRETFGVLKMGGVGDMLMATRVIAEAAKQYQRKATVFCPVKPEIFEAMPEVARVVQVKGAPQDYLLRSIADEFALFFDLRAISRAYGPEAPPPSQLALTLRWYYEHWGASLQRIGVLGHHVTTLMLESLRLPTGNITPIYTPRESSDVPMETYTVIAPGVGGLGGMLKQPDVAWWATLIERIGPCVQIGGRADALLPGAFDKRGCSLPQAAALMDGATAVVAVESGMAHLARAVGRPTVVLFGPTPVKAYGYPEHVNLTSPVCPPCFWGPLWGHAQCAMAAKTCLNLPEVEAVCQALTRLSAPLAEAVR